MTNLFSHFCNIWNFCSRKNPGLKFVYHLASRRFYIWSRNCLIAWGTQIYNSALSMDVSLHNWFILAVIHVFKIQGFQIHHRRLLFFKIEKPNKIIMNFFIKREILLSSEYTAGHSVLVVAESGLCLCSPFLGFAQDLSSSDMKSAEEWGAWKTFGGDSLNWFSDLKVDPVEKAGRIIVISLEIKARGNPVNGLRRGGR